MTADIATQYTQCSWRAPSAQASTARFAGVVLRRHVQIRDRSCVYMGCRCPARRADLDHTLDHTYGGATTEADSGPRSGPSNVRFGTVLQGA
ncbi:MAG: hypothetical protein M3460_16530 [Actinomycetota bacterium]|nr:hypothetical protein [Actinomycetota bacterium]